MPDEKEKSILKKFVDTARKKLGGPSHVAAEIFRNNQLEALRTQRIEQGIVPWSILRYQHVIDQQDTPVPLHPYSFVTPKTLELHLEYIASHCNPISLPELVRLLIDEKEIPERTVAVTFDYGHVDVFINALPLLTKHQIPATISLATAYVESQTYLPDDRITLALIALKRLELPLPKLDCFEDEFYSELERLSPGLLVTPKLIGRFLDEFRSLDENLRAIVLNAIVTPLGEKVVLPEYEDFLRWEDISEMGEHGISFATMGHAGLVSTACDESMFSDDIMYSVKIFTDNKLPMEKFYCLPEGVFSEDSLSALQKIGFRVALTIGDFPAFDKQEKEPFTLGRIRMYERVSDSVPLFACRLFRIEQDGIQF